MMGSALTPTSSISSANGATEGGPCRMSPANARQISPAKVSTSKKPAARGEEGRAGAADHGDSAERARSSARARPTPARATAPRRPASRCGRRRCRRSRSARSGSSGMSAGRCPMTAIRVVSKVSRSTSPRDLDLLQHGRGARQMITKPPAPGESDQAGGGTAAVDARFPGRALRRRACRPRSSPASSCLPERRRGLEHADAGCTAGFCPRSPARRQEKRDATRVPANST